ncbi:hypothetical protein HMPREF0063_11809 [Aeromicrobium marinum DSM 15272]|uniref:Right handed beta helix domain-containing protein n=2 Tax=Aeromicrobium marinum TaxID=219314 RepID=E2SDM3_9ACTN|nr:hypothetical protein HMPREF0063_11809 [Aeromicrobium marinum DSM 15272]
MALVATPASAAELSVCAVGCDHTTVADAVAAAAAGDTITIGAGTFPTFGVVVDKPLTIQGAGVGQTILDGGGASVGSVPGIFRILPGLDAKGSGEIIVRDMSLVNPGKNTTASQYFTISIGIKQATTGITGITLTDLDVEGTGDAARTGYGVYADTGLTGGVPRETPPLTITDSRFSEHVFNGIGVDGWGAPVTISGNDLQEGIGGSSSILVFNEYLPDRIIDPVVITDNVSDGRLVYIRNIDFNATLDTRGGFDDVTIAGNVITGLANVDAGILVSTNSTAATEPTQMGTVRVLDNDIVGDGTSPGTAGVTIGGHVIDAGVQGNSVVGVGTGVNVTQVKNQNPVSVEATDNRLFADDNGVGNTTTTTVDASRNWWGCQTDPALGAPECSGVSGTGGVTTAPWVVARLVSSADSVVEGGTATLTAALDRLSDGEPVGDALPVGGLDVQFSADRGAVDPADTVLDEALTATSTYTAPAGPGADTVTARIDLAEFEIAEPEGDLQLLAFGDAAVRGEAITLPLTITAAAVDPGTGGSGGDSGTGGSGGTGAPGSGTAAGVLPDAGSPVDAGGLAAALALLALGGVAMRMGLRVQPRHRA